MLVPVQAYLTSGVGVHREPLVAFELALRDAGIAAQNLVAVSSILPPACELIERGEGENHLAAGQILHVVLSREETSRPGERIGAAIGIARPAEASLHGFIAEYGSSGEDKASITAHAADLAMTMLAGTLGIEIDESAGAPERIRLLKESGRLRHHDAIAAVAEGDPDGRCTVCVAATVFIMEWMNRPK